MEENKKITVIDGEYPEWVCVNDIDLDAEIVDNVQVINCDTRDFAIGWQFEAPKAYKKAECNYETWTNEGLSKLYNLFRKENRDNYAIDKKDILTWLDNLCKASGGYDMDWRFLTANVKNCSDWDIKYIRFVRNDKNRDEFIVCNSYMTPIKYKEIIENLRDIIDE